MPTDASPIPLFGRRFAGGVPAGTFEMLETFEKSLGEFAALSERQSIAVIVRR
jgi:hypothetical protein